MTRYVHLTPRIEAALALIGKADTVADIGCDHGRLTAALLQRGVCSRVVASDVSARSLQKAKDLIGHIGLNDRVSFASATAFRCCARTSATLWRFSAWAER